MIEIINLIFKSFWHFVGFAILFFGFGKLIFLLVNRTFRHWTIRKHGYPPVHCDADGDFPEKEKIEEKD